MSSYTQLKDELRREGQALIEAIESRGWAAMSYGSDEGPRDLVGWTTTEGLLLFERHMRAELGDLIKWNDRKGRTQEQVLKKIRQLIKDLGDD